ncbi:MAG TPA: TolC family protein [Bacteroidales bacterium]|nr:TolC family protein [Bacteroidales bacterium]HPS73003.1 TolC family protein [Bacteroidales bacterium]
MRAFPFSLIRSGSLFIAFFLCVSSGFSQKLWTLEDCIQYAMDNNLDIKKQIQTVQSNKASLLQTGLSALPTLNAGASNIWNWGQTIDQYTNQFATTNVRSNNFSVSTQVTIFNGLQKVNTIRQNQIDLMASRYNLDVIKNNISLSVAGFYLDILFNYELVDVARAQLAITRDQEDRMNKLVEAGSSAKGDLLNIQAQRAAEELSVIQAENNLEISLLSLQQLIDLPVSKDFAVERPNLKMVDPPSGMITSDHIYEQALSSRPEIKESELKVKSAEKGVAIAQGAMSPSLYFGGTWATGYSGAAKEINPNIDPVTTLYPVGITQNTRDTVWGFNNQYSYRTISFNDQFHNNDNKSLGFSLNIPIFNGWQVHNAVSQAKIQKNIAELNLETQKRELRKIIEQSWTDATAAHKKFFSSQEKVRAQEESFKYTTQKFDVGMSTSFDYNNSKKELTTSQSELLQAKYDYIFKITILDFYMGNPIHIVRE